MTHDGSTSSCVGALLVATPAMRPPAPSPYKYGMNQGKHMRYSVLGGLQGLTILCILTTASVVNAAVVPITAPAAVAVDAPAADATAAEAFPALEAALTAIACMACVLLRKVGSEKNRVSE